MIIILAYCIYLFLVSLVIGVAVNHIIERFFLNFRGAYSVFEKTFIGLTSLIISFSILHIFVPIDWKINVFTFFAVACLLIYFWRDFIENLKKIKDKLFETNRLLLFSWLFFIIIILFCSTNAPIYNLDLGRYHFQSLLWAESYPLVPGLSNLHYRFGNWSSWYYLNGFIDNFSLEDRSFHVVNSFFYILFMTFLFFKSIDFIAKKKTQNILHLLLFLYLIFDFEFIRFWFISGLTPDLPVHLTILYFYIYLYDAIISQKEERTTLAFLTVVALFGIYVRMNAVFLIFPLSFYFLYICYRHQTFSVKYITVGVLLLLPFLIRNIILTGWILYPLAAFDFFDFDWKSPKGLLEYLSSCMRNPILRDYYENFNPKIHNSIFSIERIEVISAFAYDNVKKGEYVFLSVIGICSFIISFFWKFNKNRKLEILLLCIICLFFIWLISAAPLYRYGYSYIIAIFIFPVSYLFYKLLSNIKLRAQYLTFFLILSFIAFATIPNLPISIRQTRFLYPVEVVKLLANKETLWQLSMVPSSPYKQVNIGSGIVNIAKCDLSYANLGFVPTFPVECKALDRNIYEFDYERDNDYMVGQDAFIAKMNWKNPLPCVGGIHKGLEFRGKNLSEGFRLKN